MRQLTILGSHQSGTVDINENVACANKKAGFDVVILTAQSGDRGRDVIATKHGLGSVRVIDQVMQHLGAAPFVLLHIKHIALFLCCTIGTLFVRDIDASKAREYAVVVEKRRLDNPRRGEIQQNEGSITLELAVLRSDPIEKSVWRK